MVNIAVAAEGRASDIDIMGRLHSQLSFACSKSTIETLEKSVKYVQS